MRKCAAIEVVLTYPDGSGVNAESLNAVYTVLKPGADGDPDALKPELVVTRAHPTYSLAELTAVVLAVDAAVG